MKKGRKELNLKKKTKKNITVSLSHLQYFLICLNATPHEATLKLHKNDAVYCITVKKSIVNVVWFPPTDLPFYHRTKSRTGHQFIVNDDMIPASHTTIYLIHAIGPVF